MNWTILAAIGASLVSFAGAAIGHLVGRRAAQSHADAAVAEAESSTRAVISADWKAFSDALQMRLSAVESRSSAAEARLDAAEARAVAAEKRAVISENLYKAAVRYLRQIVTWIGERYPDEPLPPPPRELHGEL